LLKICCFGYSYRACIFQLEDFPSASVGGGLGSDDPTADFLARERAILGDDFGGFSAEDGFGSTATIPDAVPSVTAATSSANDLFPELTSPEPTTAEPQRSSFVSSFERDVEDIHPPALPHVSITGNDEVAAFEDQFPEIPSESAPAVLQVRQFQRHWENATVAMNAER
jgi:Clathrin light chain